MADPPVATWKEGTLLRGKYRIDRVLGEGGMGIVLLATHLKLHVHVAIKVLSAAVRGRATVEERFLREARAAAKLRSDHVVRVLDVDETERGVPFLVMEHLVGSDLETLLRRDGKLPAAQAADYVLQACEGLAEAHALGIVHRDLKPANLFLARVDEGSSRIKVLDFGIAKALESEDDVSLTATSGVVGSPLYMSPEQLKDARDVDLRTDIWALGVVLYQLVSGVLPFEGTSATALAARIASEPPRPLEDACPSAPAAYVEAVHRCLRKDQSERFESVRELARALVDLASEVTPAAERMARIERAATVRRVLLSEEPQGVAPNARGADDGRAEPWHDRVTAAVTDPERNTATPPLARLAVATPADVVRTDYGSELSSKPRLPVRSTRRTIVVAGSIGLITIAVGGLAAVTRVSSLPATSATAGSAAIASSSAVAPGANVGSVDGGAVESAARASVTSPMASLSPSPSTKPTASKDPGTVPRTAPTARSVSSKGKARGASSPSASPLDFELK